MRLRDPCQESWCVMFTSVLFRSLGVVAIAFSCCLTAYAQAGVVTFGDLAYAPGFNYEHGAHLAGGFTSNGTTFDNTYFPPDPNFPQFGDFWSGFGYSSAQPDLNASPFANQYSAITGASHGSGDSIYGIANGYVDTTKTLFDDTPFDPSNVADLSQLPQFVLPSGANIVGAYITNSTYAYLSMLNGDGFAKKFGGDSGNDPDFLKLSAYGTDASGNVLKDGGNAKTATFYLANFTSSDNSKDFIVADWRFFDLSGLAGAKTIYFNVSSSDTGLFGMNSPGYFAIDDIEFDAASTAVPEPASIVMLALGGLGLAIAGRARRPRNA